MGLAIDTVVTRATNPGASPFVAFAATVGDSLVVRNFAPSAYCKLIQLTRRGATSGGFRVRSPLLHDNVRGVQFITGETPSLFVLPQQLAQGLYAQDALIAEGTGGGAETDLGILTLFYSDLIGAAARLHNLGDISGIIKNIKPVQVAVTNSATIGNWTDTVITATEDLLHANTDYAVLGFVTDTAQGFVAVKGQDTANLRVGGPGSINVEDTAEYFAFQNRYHGLPFIPVINSANKGSTFVSTVDSVVSSTANVTLILAELTQNLPN
jgi:hypothetical protein